MIEQALQEARFNKSKAAKALGLTRAQLYVRMRRYGWSDSTDCRFPRTAVQSASAPRGRAIPLTSATSMRLTGRHGGSAAGAWLALPIGGGMVTQRSIEMVIGRLVTDEEFRETFLSDPHRALGELLERGTHLTHAEIAALVATDSALWEQAAEQVDPRLQKISLKA